VGDIDLESMALTTLDVVDGDTGVTTSVTGERRRRRDHVFD